MLDVTTENTDEAEQQAKDTWSCGRCALNKKPTLRTSTNAVQYFRSVLRQRKKLGTRSAAAIVLVAAAAAATAESEGVAAVVTTAAAGHTRPGPGQRRGACVSSIRHLKIATCNSSLFVFRFNS